MRIVIYLKGKPNIYGFKRKEFKWDVDLGIYVWESKKLTPEEFNKVFEEVQIRYLNEHPKVRVLVEPEAPVAPAEVTLEHAIEVIAAAHPEYLTKKAPRCESVPG